MVGAAEGPGGDQAAVPGQQPRDGIDLGSLEGFLPRQGRQDAGQALGQHGFAGAGRTDQQHVVAAGRRHHHGAAGHGLAQHIGKVGVGGPALVRVKGVGPGRLDGAAAGQSVHHLGDAAGRIDLHPVRAAGFGGLGGVASGQIEGAHPLFGGGQGHGQHPRHRTQGAVQGHLAQEGGVPRGRLDLPRRRQDGQQQGQVVDRAGLADVGGGQVDGDAAAGPAVVQVAGGGPDAVGALPHRRIRQTHDGKGVHPARDIGLHGDAEALQAVQSKTVQQCVHGGSFLPVSRPVSICPARRTAARSAGPSA